ncbi:MAG: hypothetical protein ACM3U2_18715, partial [Deltaproteobacteria bacterium]
MKYDRTRIWGHWLLSACGAVTIFYCLAVLGFVATGPEIGLRCLLVNDQKTSADGSDIGLEIRQIIADPTRDPGRGPRPGDKLIEIAREPAHTFVHFAARLLDLRSAEFPGGDRFSDKDLLTRPDQLPPVVQRGSERLVEVKYLPKGKGAPEGIQRAWLPLRSVPWQDITLTFVWFLLVFGIFAVGALAFWARPFDRQARVFFAMCTVSL